MDADTFRIWKGTPNPEAAFEVLTYLIGPEGQQILNIGSAEQASAYGAFPAWTDLQEPWLQAKAEGFPFVTNWELFVEALSYPDTPSAESWMPNLNEGWDRLAALESLLENDGTIDLEAEIEKLEADLEVIVNK
jgi:multiple sugar transport system substrate-binding protein